MTLLSNEENKEISLSSELSQASTEKVNDIMGAWRSMLIFFFFFVVVAVTVEDTLISS